MVTVDYLTTITNKVRTETIAHRSLKVALNLGITWTLMICQHVEDLITGEMHFNSLKAGQN